MPKKQKKLQGEFQALRAFLEARFQELKSELRQALGAQAKPKVTHAKKRASGHGDALVQALKSHKRGKQLVAAGKQPDQLLRSLIPLYLARELSGVEVNSGAISAFWKKQGVSYAGPNAAKALRKRIGFARQVEHGKGWSITVNGVKYVEAALAGRRAA